MYLCVFQCKHNLKIIFLFIYRFVLNWYLLSDSISYILIIINIILIIKSKHRLKIKTNILFLHKYLLKTYIILKHTQVLFKYPSYNQLIRTVGKKISFSAF